MNYDKLVDSTFLDNGLTTIADAIRAKKTEALINWRFPMVWPAQ